MSNIAILSSSLIYRPTSSPSTTQIPGVSVELELTATPNNTTKKSTIKWNLLGSFAMNAFPTSHSILPTTYQPT